MEAQDDLGDRNVACHIGHKNSVGLRIACKTVDAILRIRKIDMALAVWCGGSRLDIGRQFGSILCSQEPYTIVSINLCQHPARLNVPIPAGSRIFHPEQTVWCKSLPGAITPDRLFHPRESSF